MSEKPTRNRAEWFSLCISLALLSAVVAIVASLWLNPSLKPAEFTVELGQVRTANGHYYLPVTVKNEGDATAAEVTLEGSVDATPDDEIATTTFDFVPARSDVEGVLVFSQEPSEAAVRVISYQKP